MFSFLRAKVTSCVNNSSEYFYVMGSSAGGNSMGDAPFNF